MKFWLIFHLQPQHVKKTVPFQFVIKASALPYFPCFQKEKHWKDILKPKLEITISYRPGWFKSGLCCESDAVLLTLGMVHDRHYGNSQPTTSPRPWQRMVIAKGEILMFLLSLYSNVSKPRTGILESQASEPLS